MAITAEQARIWKTDPVAWAEANVQVEDPTTGRVGPVKFEDHHRRFLRAVAETNPDGTPRYKIVVASWCKGDGKTFCISISHAWFMSTRKNQLEATLANSKTQVQSTVFDQVGRIFKDSPSLSRLVPEAEFQRDTIRVPDGGSELRCLALNPKTVQGPRWSHISCDELHATPSPETWNVASQQIEKRRAQGLVSSQAGNPVMENPMWRYCKAVEAGAPHIYFDYATDPQTEWGRQQSERAKWELLPADYEYFWRNHWGATGLKLFSAGDIEAAVQTYEQPQTRKEWEALLKSWGDPEVYLGVGFDRAGVGNTSGDKSCSGVVAHWLAADGFYRSAVVRDTEMQEGDEEECLSEFRAIETIFGCSPMKTAMEYYGCLDLVEKVPNAELVHKTQDRQEQIYRALYEGLRDRRIWLPSDADELKSQLLTFGHGAGNNGKTVFKQQPQHDDHVDWFAWGRYAAGQWIATTQPPPPDHLAMIDRTREDPKNKLSSVYSESDVMPMVPTTAWPAVW